MGHHIFLVLFVLWLGTCGGWQGDIRASAQQTTPNRGPTFASQLAWRCNVVQQEGFRGGVQHPRGPPQRKRLTGQGTSEATITAHGHGATQSGLVVRSMQTHGQAVCKFLPFLWGRMETTDSSSVHGKCGMERPCQMARGMAPEAEVASKAFPWTAQGRQDQGSSWNGSGQRPWQRQGEGAEGCQLALGTDDGGAAQTTSGTSHGSEAATCRKCHFGTLTRAGGLAATIVCSLWTEGASAGGHQTIGGAAKLGGAPGQCQAFTQNSHGTSFCEKGAAEDPQCPFCIYAGLVQLYQPAQGPAGGAGQVTAGAAGHPGPAGDAVGGTFARGVSNPGEARGSRCLGWGQGGGRRGGYGGGRAARGRCDCPGAGAAEAKGRAAAGSTAAPVCTYSHAGESSGGGCQGPEACRRKTGLTHSTAGTHGRIRGRDSSPEMQDATAKPPTLPAAALKPPPQ